MLRDQIVIKGARKNKTNKPAAIKRYIAIFIVRSIKDLEGTSRTHFISVLSQSIRKV